MLDVRSLPRAIVNKFSGYVAAMTGKAKSQDVGLEPTNGPRTPQARRDIRKSILGFENVLSRQKGAFVGDNVSCPLKHSFAPGMYVREIFLPKGTTATGKIHRHSHPNFLIKGEVRVVTEFGGVQHLKAPVSMISKAGTKRAVHAIEDTVWITVHATNDTDLKKIEETVIAPTYNDLEIGRAEERSLMEPVLSKKNCLILALKELGRDYSPLLELEPTGTFLPFKESLEALREKGVSVEGLSCSKGSNGIWHVEAKDGVGLEGLELEDSELVGTWIAVGVGGATLVGGAASASGGKKASKGASAAAQAQLQATRESIVAQQEGADKGYGIFQSEAAKARRFLTDQSNLALEELQPLKEIGLANLEQASGFADPNSEWSQKERDAYSRTLERNLAARGLTASGTEIAGLSDFELGLARERRNMSLGLAGQGANTLQSLAGIHNSLGAGTAGIYNQLGQAGSAIYGGLGQGVGSALQQGAAAAGNMNMLASQYQAQGLVGASNAFQAGLGGLGQYYGNQQAMAQQAQQFNQILNALGGGGSLAGLGAVGSAGGYGGTIT